MATAEARAHDFATTEDGALTFHLHPGQQKAWDSPARFVAVLAGTQGGKTCFGPAWLWREIRARGPGDYLVVTPTFTLLELKALPEFKKLFEQWLDLGTYKQSPVRVFEFSAYGEAVTHGTNDPDHPTRVYFGYAENPESLESATAKAAWLDEAGQKKFKLASWEAIQRRLSIAEGRCLITTTPYNLGWLKTEIHDRAKTDPEIEVVRFESTMNPAFPRAEYERAKRTLPRWKFDLFYRAIFTRPAGLIYDAFDPDYHTIPRYRIPEEWPRYIGVDFGGVNTAAVFYARSPEGQLTCYRTYHAGERTAKEHVRAMLEGEPAPAGVWGGAPSEGQWRREFRDAGLPIQRPKVGDVEVGIDRVYAAHRAGRIFVFDDLRGYLDEKMTYAREVDDSGQPTEKIEDKNLFHRMDAERYVIGSLHAAESGGKTAMVNL